MQIGEAGFEPARFRELNDPLDLLSYSHLSASYCLIIAGKLLQL